MKDVRNSASEAQNNWRKARYDLIVLLERNLLYRFEGSETKLHNANAERLVREAGRPTSDEDSCEADPAGA